MRRQVAGIRLCTSARLIILFAVFAAPATLRAQHLSVQGNRFAIDGNPQFLTFVSYFGAMSADDVTADLRFLRSKGFDGVRIWTNWRTGLQLMKPDGSLSDAGAARLRFILDRAREERFVVDLTFTAETVQGLTTDRYRLAIATATAMLEEYDNVLFDIENERNEKGPLGQPLAAGDVAAIRDAIKRVDPHRIVTASNSAAVTAAFAAKFTNETALDVTAYHDPREASWYRADQIESIVAALRANGRPAYLQEPTRFPFPSTDRPEYFREALANAKLAGAAAWCFHTNLTFDIGGAGPVERLFEARDRPDGQFLNALDPALHFRTASGIHYVTAEGGGGGDANATRMAAGLWETFRVTVIGGGPLVSGDHIALRTSDGFHYLQAVGGGGVTVRAVGLVPGPWETFIIEKAGGGAIRPGDAVTLKTAANPVWYVCAEDGGGSRLSANRAAAGLWETFTVAFAR